MNTLPEEKIYHCFIEIKKLQKKIARESLSTKASVAENARILLLEKYLFIGENIAAAELLQNYVEQYITEDTFYTSTVPAHFYLALLFLLLSIDKKEEAQYHLSSLEGYLKAPAPESFPQDALQFIRENAALLGTILYRKEDEYAKCPSRIEKGIAYCNEYANHLPADYSISIHEFYALCYEICGLTGQAIAILEKTNAYAKQNDCTLRRVAILKKISHCHEVLGNYEAALAFFNRHRQKLFALSDVKNRAYSRYLIGLYGIDKQQEETAELSEKNKHLAGKVNRDSLTGTYNRHFMQTLFSECDLSRTKSDSYGAIMLDIDNFKAYNDNYGHLAGDEVLSNIGVILQNLTTDRILPIRYGGEEFVIFIKNPKTGEIKRLATKVLEDVRSLAILHNYSSVKPYVTVSIGIAEAKCDSSEAMGELYIHADEALYTSKNSGKDKISVYRR